MLRDALATPTEIVEETLLSAMTATAPLSHKDAIVKGLGIAQEVNRSVMTVNVVLFHSDVAVTPPRIAVL